MNIVSLIKNLFWIISNQVSLETLGLEYAEINPIPDCEKGETHKQSQGSS